jgi:hypothetical protein
MVKDPTGAMVPGAKILAKNAATGAEYSTSTTGTGNFTLGEVPGGSYSVTVSMAGFKTLVRQGITVVTAQTLRLDLALEVGAITESVTVSSDAPLLRTESGDLSQNVQTDTLEGIPVLSIGGAAGSTGIRNPYAVMQLLPGADWRPDAVVRVNGTPGNTQAMRVEGMDATNNMWQQMGQYVQQGVDAIQEFAIQTSNYAAEYGQAGSAVFNLTMKSGTNQIHGSAYEYFVNEALNASTPYSEDAQGNKTRNKNRRNDYGFTLGGPIYLPKIYDGRDKSFFFFNFEQYRFNGTAATKQTIPTMAMRQGDFSAIKSTTPITDGAGTPILDAAGRQVFENTIYDWRTEHTVGGTRVWDPFPNNQLPSEVWDKSAVLIQQKFPNPDNTDLVQNWTTRTGNTNLAWIPSVKIDYSLSAKAKLSGYWSRNYSETTANDGLDVSITGGVPGKFTSHTVRINYDYTLRPTMLLHIGVGMMHNTMNQLAPEGVDTATTFQMKTKAKGFPYIAAFSNSKGGMSLPMGTIMNSQLQNIKPTANPSLSWIKGNHSYKFGAELIVESHPSYSETFANNWFNFSASQTGDPEYAYGGLSGKTVGFPYASFLAGRSDWGFTNAPSRGHLGAHMLAFYAQDSWKVTPKVTLDYGLRYDYQTYLKEQYGRWANFSPTTPNPVADNLPGAVIFEGSGPGRCNCDFAKVYPYAFGPRVGIAYQFMPKTVLRAGAGISYGRTGEVAYKNNTLSSMVLYGFAKLPGAASAQLTDGPPAEYQVVWPDIRAGAFPKLPDLGAPPMAIDNQAGRPPRILQWSIGIQRELAKDLAVEVTYVGNRGAWWEANELVDINSMTPAYLAKKGINFNDPSDRALLTQPYYSLTPDQQAKWPIPFASFPTYNTLVQALRPFPQFTGIPQVWSPLGKTWYDALQVRVTKRFAHNFDANYNFTFQKEMQMGSELSFQGFGSTFGGGQINDVANRNVNKYLSALSRPVVSNLALSYSVPKVFVKYRLLSEIVRDWQFTAVMRYSSAQPIGVAKANGNLNTVLARATNTFVNRVPGQALFLDQKGNAVDLNSNFDPATTFVLNPKAWSQPADGQFGTATAYYNDFRGRRHPTENMSIGRNFRFGNDGRVVLNIKAEFTNIFNRLYVPVETVAATNIGDTQTYKAGGVLTSGGFGYINMQSPSVGANVRQGQIVGRLTF